MSPPRVALALVAASCTAAALAGEFYTSGGLPGATAGWASPLSSRLMLRADLSALGGIGRDSIEEGGSYSNTLRSDRASFMMDWFVLGGVRVTGGLTFNRMRVDLRAPGGIGTLMLGEAAIAAPAAERLDVALRWPATTTYLGVGYDHPLGSGSAFLFDFGGSIGKASLSEPHSGPPLGSGAQAELDREFAQLRDGVGRYRFVPQVSFGVNWRF